ncbi:MAG: hypothetical protein QGG64_27760, partial [Candidatus Latescibacteria bacterium]|nr:hypothetical protein [Candidatus Latescibacterota bacterium]
MDDPENHEELREALAQAIAHRDVLSEEMARTTSLLEDKVQALSGVRRIVDALKHMRDIPTVFEIILDAVLEETDAENCSLMTLDKKKEGLIFRAAKGQMDTVA